jgi:hypothetical protein
MNVCIKSNEVQLAQEVYKQVGRGPKIARRRAAPRTNPSTNPNPSHRLTPYTLPPLPDRPRCWTRAAPPTW